MTITTDTAPSSIELDPGVSPECRKHLWLRRLLVVFVVGVVLLICAYTLRAPLFSAFANAWIIDEAPAKADAIVVLGGGVEYRPLAAAKLYKAGYTPKILIMDVSLSWAEQSGLKESERSLTQKILVQQGVPADAIEPVGHSVHNTSEESLAVRDWAKTHGATRLLVTTEIFHTRRVKWLFRKRFKNTGTEVRVVAAQPWDYRANNWWTVEQGVLAFQNEWVKLPYYLVKY